MSDIRPYKKIADDFGVKLIILEATGNYKSIHNIPKATIDRMRKQYEILDYSKI